MRRTSAGVVSCLWYRIIPTVALVLLVVGCSGGPGAGDQTGHTLYAEHDAMRDHNDGTYKLGEAFEPVTTVGRVEVWEDDTSLDPIEYLGTGAWGYVVTHRDSMWEREEWQVYLLSADKYSWDHEWPWDEAWYGMTFHSSDPAVVSESKCIVFTGTVHNTWVQQDPIYACWKLNYRIACRSVTLHEIGEAFNLGDTEPLGGEDNCEWPENPGIMVHRHLSSLTLWDYAPGEIQRLIAAGQP